ncbi:hypothetical protein L581_2526 [Serratia fonticola AU-AP2C]|nr:hypothetical protein L581_2526 [Serratia fonticola AU-AP2C]
MSYEGMRYVKKFAVWIPEKINPSRDGYLIDVYRGWRQC